MLSCREDSVTVGVFINHPAEDGDVSIASRHLLEQILEQFRVRTANLFLILNTKCDPPPSVQNTYGTREKEE